MKERANPAAVDEYNLCVSIFKSGESTTTKTQFTKAWIDLINRIEKGKSLNTSHR